jgi:acyl-CoA reductase-like NAD-dependent aldehyde dehydrogenase
VPGRTLQAADIELALDAAHAAKDGWGRTAPPSAR